MVNITTNGKVLVLNGKSTIPIGSFRVFKNELLRTITLYGINGYDLEITLVEGYTTVNSEIYSLDTLFDFISKHSTFKDAPMLELEDGSVLDVSSLATKIELASKADKSALDEYTKTNIIDRELALKANLTDLNAFTTLNEFRTTVLNKVEYSDLLNYYTINEVDLKLDSKLTEAQVNYIIRNKADRSEIPDVSSYVKQDYVDSKIDSIVIPTINLDPYATKNEVENKLLTKANISDIPDVSNLVTTTELNDAITNIVIPTIDTDNFATKVELNTKANVSDIPDVSGLATVSYVDSKFDNIVIPNYQLDSFATKVQLNQVVANSATKAELNDVAAMIPDVSRFVDSAYVEGLIDNLPEVDLTPYEKTSDLTNKLDLKVDKSDLDGVVRTSDIVDFALKSELETKANISDIPSLNGYARENYVDGKFNSIVIPDVSIYETIVGNDIKLFGKMDKSAIPNPENLATKSFVANEIANAQIGDGGTVNLDGLVTKDELDEALIDLVTNDNLGTAISQINIPDISNLSTYDYVDGKFNSIVIPEVDLRPYETKMEVDRKLNNKANISDIPDVSNFVTDSEMSSALDLKPNFSDIPNVDNFIVESDVTGMLVPYAKTNDVTQALASKADKTEIPSIDGLAVMDDVVNLFESIPITYLTPYETISTNNTKLALKADKSEIPSLDEYAKTVDVYNYVDGHPNLASKTFVENYISGLDLPDFDTFETKDDALAKYATKADTQYVDSKLSTKANRNEIPSIEGLATIGFVNDELDKKTDIATFNLEMDLKADKAAMEISLDSKADKLAMSDALDTKADMSYVYNTMMTYQNNINTITNNIDRDLRVLIDDKFIDYYTKPQTDELFNEYYDIDEVDGLLSNYKTSTEIGVMMSENNASERVISDDKYFMKPANPSAALYNTTGIASLAPKIWVGSIVSGTDGMFTATFTGADFTVPPMVVATANTISDSTAAGNANWVSIYQNSITTTGFKGRTKNANSAGALVAVVNVNEPNVEVNIIAIGY